jgi:hypothetical protein
MRWCELMRGTCNAWCVWYIPGHLYPAPRVRSAVKRHKGIPPLVTIFKDWFYHFFSLYNTAPSSTFHFTRSSFITDVILYLRGAGMVEQPTCTCNLLGVMQSNFSTSGDTLLGHIFLIKYPFSVGKPPSGHWLQQSSVGLAFLQPSPYMYVGQQNSKSHRQINMVMIVLFVHILTVKWI